jgi:hypothetical protein
VRATLSTLLALADEISAGALRGLDHSVAHLRLEWWRGEAERYARGQPQHPWLRALLAQHPSVQPLNLQPLVEAAAVDLASETLSAQPGAALQRALFELAAAALRPEPGADAASARLQCALSDLADCALQLERFAAARPRSPAPSVPSDAAAALATLRRQAPRIERALQPQLTPLLVWIALAARQAERRARRPDSTSGSRLDAFADNIVAWRAARRASRGRFRID